MKKLYLKMITTNYCHSISKLTLITFFSIFTFSCSNDDDDVPSPVIIKEISQEIKDLIYFKGDEKASTVLINIQGGPSTEFSPDIVNLIFGNANTTDLLTLNVHQAQTLNPSIIDDNDITLEQAVTFNTESIEILSKVISYFKDEGRTVYILGFSFGAFMTQELIAKKGIDVADKYLIITGRLDINEVMWQGFAEGKEGYFENGVTPVLDADPHPEVIDRNLNRMNAGLGMNRYTQVFNTIEDLSNITYIYGATDEAVGSLTDEEVQFLESKNTNIIVGSGGHSDTFWNFLAQGLNDTFEIEQLP